MNVHNMIFESLIKKCHMIDDRHRAKQAQLRLRAFEISLISESKSSEVADINLATSRSLVVNFEDDSMNLSIINARKRDSLTSEEKQHRLINNL